MEHFRRLTLEDDGVKVPIDKKAHENLLSMYLLLVCQIAFSFDAGGIFSSVWFCDMLLSFSLDLLQSHSVQLASLALSYLKVLSEGWQSGRSRRS